MLLYDDNADAAFGALIDARFPYSDRAQASALIAEGWSISLNAAFSVLHEIARPVSREVDPSRLTALLLEWRCSPEHPLKAPLIVCAEALISDRLLPWPDAVAIMDEIANYAGQRAALSIAYFSADGAEDGDDALELAHQRICREWAQSDV